MTPKNFHTTDVYLTAALSAKGKRPDKVTTLNERMTFHWMTKPDEARLLADEYYRKALQVDSRTFADEIRSIKTLCHNPVAEQHQYDRNQRKINDKRPRTNAI